MAKINSLSTPPRIFISYARSDGEAFAKDLRQRLENAGLSLWHDRANMEGGKDWWEQIGEALNHVEYMVLVMTPAALRSDIVRKEWRLARQQGVCVVPVAASSNLDFDSLPRWMRETHFVTPDISDQWHRFVLTLQSPCHTPRVPFMVEDVPDYFVPRSDEFDQLVRVLLDEQREEAIAITAALRGAGGYGKTTLAKALCHDPRVQEAFHDGILWVTLGETPGDLTNHVLDLIEILSGERPSLAGIEAATARFTERLADRDMPLVIDDVWHSADLKPFLQGGPRCARLITTRDSTTLPVTSQKVAVDAMQQTEAVMLLRTGLPAGEDNALRALGTRLGEWPLLLRLTNATLRSRVVDARQPLSAAIDYVNKALDKRGLTAFDARDATERTQAVAKTLGVSLELLSEKERSRYTELAIFPEDVDIPLATLERLWRTTDRLDEFDTEELCSRLYQLSLLWSFNLTTRYVRLHDVFRMYLQKELGDRTASVHSQLLDTYELTSWATLSSQEPYLWQYLAYHLLHANRQDELRRLLLGFDWLQAIAISA